jgi:hypothetical protein
MAAVLRGEGSRGEWSPKQYSVSSNEGEVDADDDDEHLDAEDAILSPNINNGEDQHTMNDIGDDDDYMHASGLGTGAQGYGSSDNEENNVAMVV